MGYTVTVTTAIEKTTTTFLSKQGAITYLSWASSMGYVLSYPSSLLNQAT